MNEVFVNAADLASFDPSNAGERLRRYQFALQRALDRTMDQLGEPHSERDSDPAETADRRNPDLDSPTEAVSASPIAAAGRVQPEPAPVEPESRGLDAPNKANLDQVVGEIRTANAPNKANSLLGGVKLSSAVSPKSPTRPIVRETKPGPVDSGRSGWLDISIEKR
jgi:hypothetical protein